MRAIVNKLRKASRKRQRRMKADIGQDRKRVIERERERENLYK